MYNIKEYGAKGDGAADDSGAFQAAIDAIATAGRGTLFVPAGEYRVNRQIACSVSGWNLAVAGEGVGVSKIFSSAPDGVFSFEYEDPQSQTTIRELSLFADGPDAGPAFEITQKRSGNAHHRNLSVQNVEIRGLDPKKDFFRYGVKLSGVWRPFFLNVHFAGPFGPGVRQDYTEDSGMFRAAAGFEARDCYAPSFQHCYSWGAAVSFRVVSEKNPGPEDGAFYRCFAVESRIGIEVSTGGAEPQLVIDACHINCRDIGVSLRHRKYFHIVHCLFYNDDYHSAAPGYQDIFLENSFGGLISGNVFHQPGNRNRTMIALGEGSRDLQLRGNLFNARGLALARVGERKPVELVEQTESLATEGIIVEGNQFAGHYREPAEDGEYRPAT